MEMPVGDVLPELLLIGGGALILVFALFAPRTSQSWAAALALATIAGAAALIAARMGTPPAATFFGTYALDGVAAWGQLIVLGVTAAVVGLSVPWFREDPRHGEYYTLLLYSALGAVLLAGALDLMELVLALLMSSATGYVLAAYHRRSRMASEAAIKYYLLGALTNGGLLYGVALLFGLGGTTIFGGLRGALADSAGTWVLGVAVGLVIVGLAFKMGAAPAHAWMPDVAEGAPAPVAAFLTIAPKVGALIVLGRLAAVLPETEVGWRPLVAGLSALTMTLGNLAALRQDDVRRLLGWSAVSQTGYALMALVVLGRSALALPALVFFLLAYALANVAAFAVVVELRGLAERGAYAGLARTRPALAAALTLAFLSFIGIPPLAGFSAKLALFGATIEGGYAWLAVVAGVNTVISLAYYARVLGPAYFEESKGAQPVLAPTAAVIAVACAAGLLLVGLGSGAVFSWLRGARLLPW